MAVAEEGVHSQLEQEFQEMHDPALPIHNKNDHLTPACQLHCTVTHIAASIVE